MSAPQPTVVEAAAEPGTAEVPTTDAGTTNGPAERGRQSGRWWTRTTDLFLIREAL